MMMRVMKYIKASLLAVTILLAGSCTEDFLDTEPSTALDEDFVFKTYQTAESALVGAYDALSSYAFEGLFMPIMNDLMGEDLLINSENNWGWFVEVYELNVLPNYSWARSPWTTGYGIIYNANRIIEAAPQIPEATDEEKDNLIGQAKVMRAFVMLKLVQMYAPAVSVNPDAPGILNVNKVFAHDDEDITRAPVGEIYEQIITDLTSATNLLVEAETEDEIFNTGFFGLRAAHAVLARAHLDLQNWEEARDNAALAREDMELEFIGELNYGMFRPNIETIFSVAYTEEDNNIYLSIPSFYYPYFGYSSIRVETAFAESFGAGDARKISIKHGKELVFGDEPVDEDNYVTTKFWHNASVGNAERISIRASEMVLIEAESEYELGNEGEARILLHEIQTRAGAPKYNNSGEALLEEILMERRKELYGEGFRWSDIKRRSLPVVREGDHWARFDFSAMDEDYYRMTFPIPQSEIDNNQVLTEEDQNTGY